MVAGGLRKDDSAAVALGDAAAGESDRGPW
jgi:hypothetical protein